MTHKDKQDVIAICNILADKMSDSGQVAVQQIIGAVEDMVENEPCEDCISRDEALRIAKSYYHAEYVVDKIRQLPSVTPERPKGKWIDGYCSECGKSCLCDGWGIDIESKYCPNCGSYNGGENDEHGI